MPTFTDAWRPFYNESSQSFLLLLYTWIYSIGSLKTNLMMVGQKAKD